MKPELFSELMQSMREILEHAQGKRALRTTTLPGPPREMSAKDIRTMRDAAKASQAVFAHYLNVSTKLVQAWEGGRRTPDGPALRLLELARREPRLVFGGMLEVETAKKSPKRRAITKKVALKKSASRARR